MGLSEVQRRAGREIWFLGCLLETRLRQALGQRKAEALDLDGGDGESEVQVPSWSSCG